MSTPNCWEQILAWANGTHTAMREEPVAANADRDEMRSRLAREYDFWDAHPPATLLADLSRLLRSGMVNTNHPGYLGFGASSTRPGCRWCASRIPRWKAVQPTSAARSGPSTVWISDVRVAGETVLRSCICNHHTRSAQIRELISQLDRLVASGPSKRPQRNRSDCAGDPEDELGQAPPIPSLP